MTRVLRGRSLFLALVFGLFATLGPVAGLARPGLGGSMGSRGSMTYSSPRATGLSPNGASPIGRSMTPQSSPSYGTSGYGGAGYGNAGYGYGRSGFATGFLGGLVGAGLGGMLFGRGFFGGGLGGFGLLGMTVQFALIFFLVRWLIRSFAGAPAFAGGVPFLRQGQPRPNVAGGGTGAARRQITIGPADYQAFSQALTAIQAAWSRQDLATLSALVTPEMLSYFSEQLSDLASRGLRNEVRDVRLIQGDLAEAWGEGNRDYATVAMRYALIDVTLDAAGRIVDGSPTEHVTVTEYWTFVRASGGRWILSAIQQTR